MQALHESTAKASPRGTDPSVSDRRSAKEVERALYSLEERKKIEKELLNRKNTYGGRYRPFQPSCQNGEQKSKAKLEVEEYKNKMRYREFLLDLVEKKVRLRRDAHRRKKIDSLR